MGHRDEGDQQWVILLRGSSSPPWLLFPAVPSFYFEKGKCGSTLLLSVLVSRNPAKISR